MQMNTRILRLNKAGVPLQWLDREDAATLLVKGLVVWSLGDSSVTIRGGINCHGLRSILNIPTIIATTEMFTTTIITCPPCATAYCSDAIAIPACTAAISSIRNGLLGITSSLAQGGAVKAGPTWWQHVDAAISAKAIRHPKRPACRCWRSHLNPIRWSIWHWQTATY